MFEFIQVTARKGDDVSYHSNTSLVENQKMTEEQAQKALVQMASEFAANGYDVKWTRQMLPRII